MALSGWSCGWFLNYFLCFLFRMYCSFSQQFAVESGKLSARGLSVCLWLSLVNHALPSVPQAWIFQVAEFLGCVKVLRIWRAVKSRWVFLLSFQGPGTLKPILPQNHFTMQPPGWFYGGGPASGQAVLRKPKSTLRLPGGTSFCCGCLVASPMS